MSQDYTFLLPDGEVALNVGKKEGVESSPTDTPEAKTKKATPTSRRFCLISYIDPEALLQFLKRCEWIQHWSMTTHDRDVLPNGKIKERHTHVLLYTYSHKTSSAIKKNFERFSAEYYKGKGEVQNTLSQICHDMVKQYRYQLHLDDPDKAQYHPNERITDSVDYWIKYESTCGMNDSQTNVGLAMVNDILDGVSTITMCERYGKEYIYHRTHLHNVAQNVIADETRRAFEKHKDLRPFDLMGLIDAEVMLSPFTVEQQGTFFRVLEHVLTELALNGETLVGIDKQSKERIK